MKSDLSKVKVGDIIWTVRSGNVVVVDTAWSDVYPIKTSDKMCYTADGRRIDSDQHPSAFLTNPFENEEWKERVMEVSENGKNWDKRVVFGIVRGMYIAYNGAKSFSELSKDMKHTNATFWKFAREVQSESVEMTIAEIEAALGKKIKIKS
jgi:hypothetical protein